MAVYELKQFGCDNCGALTDVLDPDESIPKGWIYGDGRHECYCPDCVRRLGIKTEIYGEGKK